MANNAKEGETVKPSTVAKSTIKSSPRAMAALDSAGVNLYEGSLKEILPPLISNPLAYNEFFTNLYNKFIMTQVVNGRFENPLAVLKKDKLPPFGDTVERMIFNPATAIEYSADDSNNDNILTYVHSDIKVEYIKVNREDEYRIYIPRQRAMQMFSSEGAFGEFLDGAMASMYNGDSIDEFRLMLKIVSDIYKIGALNTMVLPANAVDVTKMLVNTIKLFKIPSTKYNAYSRLYSDSPLTTWSNPKRIVVIAKVEFLTSIKVDFLASVFNLSQVDLDAMFIEVDEFEDPNIECFVGDISYFRVHDVLRSVEEFVRADKLAIKSYYHVWQAINASLFANAVCFVKAGTTPPEPKLLKADAKEISIQIPTK